MQRLPEHLEPRSQDLAHHGRFLRQLVGGRGQVAGADVILVHRLLKNGITPKRAYLLLTEAALRWVGIDAAGPDLAMHVERYEHLGDVRCFVRDFADTHLFAQSALATSNTLLSVGTVRSSSTGENGTGTSIAPMRLTGASR